MIVSLVTTSAMLRRHAEDEPADPASKSARFSAALERARGRAVSSENPDDRRRDPGRAPAAADDGARASIADRHVDLRDAAAQAAHPLPAAAVAFDEREQFAREVLASLDEDPCADRPPAGAAIASWDRAGDREEFAREAFALARAHPDERARPWRSAPPAPAERDEPAIRDTASAAPRASRSAPSRSAPLALLLRRDAMWQRAAAAVGQDEPCALGPQAARVRDHLAATGASFLSDIVAAIDLPPDEIEEALWELVGAGLATADGFASLRVLVSRRRGEVKSHFDRVTATAAAEVPPVRKWQDAIRKARTRDRERPSHALRSLPTAAGRWSLLPPADASAIDAEASARQLLHRYGVVFRDLVTRESSLPPLRDLLVALRRLEARGEIRGGRFVTGFVGEQFALPEALDELRAVRHPGPAPEACRVAATDPVNLVGVLSPGPRVPAIVGNLVLYVDGTPVASLEAGKLVLRAPLPPGARIDEDLTYHPPPRPAPMATQAALPL